MIDRWAELAHAPQMCCFSPCYMFSYCLGSIHLIIDGYLYVIRLGGLVSRFFIREQDCCCTAAAC